MKSRASTALPYQAASAQPASAAARPTTRCGAYACRHQRCSMARPRSIASQGVRRRSAMAMSAGCIASSSEQEVEEEDRPAGNAGNDLDLKADFRERRPERFDERGGEE